MEGNPHHSLSLRLRFIICEVMIVSLAKSTHQIDLGTIQSHRQTSSGASSLYEYKLVFDFSRAFFVSSVTSCDRVNKTKNTPPFKVLVV